MADIRAEDLTQETKSTLDGSEQFIMFDSTEGKRGTVSDVGDYILQNGDASGQGDTVADMIADVPTGDTVSFTQTQTSGDELGTITINGTGKKIYGKSYANKQDKLVSGTNIKTINGDSLLGSGNIVIQGGGGSTVSYTQTQTSGNELGTITIDGDSKKIYSPTETDPTVPSWAKASTKPSYTASEVGAVPTTRKVNNKALSSDVTLNASDVGAQETLVSGTNIKTVNNESLLGSGNITIQGGAGADVTQVSITVANWNATTTCTKTVTGVTTSNSVIVSPAPASIADYVSAGVYCSAQGSGTLTFTASSTPTADLVVNVMIVG